MPRSEYPTSNSGAFGAHWKLEIAFWKLGVPLFLLYLCIAAAGWNRTPVQDEPRYLGFADNLAHGFYSPRDAVQLWSGPGYPLLLAPFRAIGFGPGALRLLNAPLLFAAVWCFFRFLRNHLPARAALLGAGALGLYFPVWKFLPSLMTEVLALCLVCLLLWAWSEILRRERISWAWLVIAGIAFAWLCLTRSIFGYVLFACLVIYLLCAALTRMRSARRLLLAHVIAAALCLPWLGYTYSRTGKLFYWATAGGMSFYWMASSGEGEWGDWQGFNEVRDTPELAPHREFFAQLNLMNEVQCDDALKARARENLAAHPSAYLRNLAANLSRMFFSFPYIHTQQKLSTLFYALPNSFLLAFTTLALVRLARRARAAAAPLWPYLLFAGAGFAGTALLSAYPRMLFPFVPIMLFLIVRDTQSTNPELQREP
jgi:4-amino-4-deoxy-L-arabinose transferase-like glycosyltransferase